MAAGSVRDENTNFESVRTSSMSEKKKKQSLRTSKVSSNHQIPSNQTNNTTSMLNEYTSMYINKLTLPYFNSFCQPFHIPFFIIFDQCLFCCYEKLFQLAHKKDIKSRNNWLLIYCLFHYFPMFSKNAIQ